MVGATFSSLTLLLYFPVWFISEQISRVRVSYLILFLGLSYLASEVAQLNPLIMLCIMEPWALQSSGVLLVARELILPRAVHPKSAGMLGLFLY